MRKNVQSYMTRHSSEFAIHVLLYSRHFHKKSGRIQFPNSLPWSESLDFRMLAFNKMPIYILPRRLGCSCFYVKLVMHCSSKITSKCIGLILQKLNYGMWSGVSCRIFPRVVHPFSLYSTLSSKITRIRTKLLDIL